MQTDSNIKLGENAVTAVGLVNLDIPNPQEIIEHQPLPESIERLIQLHRREITNILNGQDQRFLVTAGPCSLSEIEETIQFGEELSFHQQYLPFLKLNLRMNADKPRSNPKDWKGIAYAPKPGDPVDIRNGIITARAVYIETMLRTGLGIAVEALNIDIHRCLSDLTDFDWIGARNVDDIRLHDYVRFLNSAVGVKNPMNGNINTLINTIFAIRGDNARNQTILPILRGTNTGPNYLPDNIILLANQMIAAGLNPSCIIDICHGNCLDVNGKKSVEIQKNVLDNIIRMIHDWKDGSLIRSIIAESGKDGMHSHTDPLMPSSELIPRLYELNRVIGKVRFGS